MKHLPEVKSSFELADILTRGEMFLLVFVLEVSNELGFT